MSITKVLIVDDSAVVRQVISGILGDTPGLQVIGAAPDPVFAMQRMSKEWPDVIVLDIEMPRMDGITFLKKIMATRPTPVVICSTLTEKGAQITLEALSAGAVGVVTKPKTGLKSFLADQSTLLVDAVKAAARVNVERLRGARPLSAPVPTRPVEAAGLLSRHQSSEQVVVIGTSTGGTQALEVILTALPRTCPGLVIVQHMPEKFTAAFAARLDQICEIEVKEAADGDRVLPGRALVAPGGLHMLLKRSGAQYQVEVRDGPLVNRHRPGIDVLFRSAAKHAGKNAMGIIMTGMGDDGAAGLLEMRQAGAYTVSEDESTCVVYGMPKEAVKRGAVMRVIRLDDIPRAVMDYAAGRGGG